MKTDSIQQDGRQEWAWLLLIAPLSAMMTILIFVDSFILWAIGIAVAIALPLFLFHLNRRESKIRDVAENYIQLWRSTPELDRTNREHSLLIKTGACNLWTNAELTEARRRIKAKDVPDPNHYGHPKDKHLLKFLKFCKKHDIPLSGELDIMTATGRFYGVFKRS